MIRVVSWLKMMKRCLLKIVSVLPKSIWNYEICNILTRLKNIEEAKVIIFLVALLMYHAQLGREYHEKALKYRSLAMRSLAHSGTSHSLDLHGATVREAKTIVRGRVAAWWAKEADTSPNSIRPFVIVTGRGNHSIGLEARLLPAIVRLLQQDHWRFDAEHSQITVYGINRHSKLNSNA
nr:unnamed protein product [Schizosaccharomyces pombe]